MKNNYFYGVFQPVGKLILVVIMAGSVFNFHASPLEYEPVQPNVGNVGNVQQEGEGDPQSTTLSQAKQGFKDAVKFVLVCAASSLIAAVIFSSVMRAAGTRGVRIPSFGNPGIATDYRPKSRDPWHWFQFSGKGRTAGGSRSFENHRREMEEEASKAGLQRGSDGRWMTEKQRTEYKDEQERKQMLHQTLWMNQGERENASYRYE